MGIGRILLSRAMKKMLWPREWYLLDRAVLTLMEAYPQLQEIYEREGVLDIHIERSLGGWHSITFGPLPEEAEEGEEVEDEESTP